MQTVVSVQGNTYGITAGSLWDQKCAALLCTGSEPNDGGDIKWVNGWCRPWKWWCGGGSCPVTGTSFGEIRFTNPICDLERFYMVMAEGEMEHMGFWEPDNFGQGFYCQVGRGWLLLQVFMRCSGQKCEFLRTVVLIFQRACASHKWHVQEVAL